MTLKRLWERSAQVCKGWWCAWVCGNLAVLYTWVLALVLLKWSLHWSIVGTVYIFDAWPMSWACEDSDVALQACKVTAWRHCGKAIQLLVCSCVR